MYSVPSLESLRMVHEIAVLAFFFLSPAKMLVCWSRGYYKLGYTY